MIQRYVFPALIYFGYMQSLWLILAYIPLYLESLGFTHLQISFLISLFSLFPLLLVIPFGVFSDRVSPKRLVILGLLLLSLFSLLVRFFESFRAFLILFVMGGLGTSIFLVSCSSLYYKILGKGNRGKKIGFFSSIGMFGYGIGPFWGSVLLNAVSLQDLFTIIFFMILPFLGLSFFLLDVKPEPFRLSMYRKDLSRYEVLILVAITFLIAIHFGAERTSLSLFLKFNAGVAENRIGIIFFCVGITLAMVILSLGFVSDIHPNLKALLLSGLLISGTFNVAMLLVHSFSGALAVRLLHVVGDSAYLIAQRIAISNLFTPTRIGGNIGVFNTTTTFGAFVGALMSGIVPGYVYPFVVSGGLSLLGGLIFFFLNPDFSPKH